jgi:glycosyltransferase involved in cell wall biosynthesis
MENGILLKKMGDSKELANAISLLLSNELLQEEFGKSFSENIRINHSQSRYAADLILKINMC